MSNYINSLMWNAEYKLAGQQIPRSLTGVEQLSGRSKPVTRLKATQSAKMPRSVKND